MERKDGDEAKDKEGECSREKQPEKKVSPRLTKLSPAVTRLWYGSTVCVCKGKGAREGPRNDLPCALTRQ